MYNRIEEIRQPKTETEFFVKFDRPESLPDPMPIFYNSLYDLKDKIGVEKVTINLDTFTNSWALNNGYQLETDKATRLHTFTHVSLID